MSPSTESSRPRRIESGDDPAVSDYADLVGSGSRTPRSLPTTGGTESATGGTGPVEHFLAEGPIAVERLLGHRVVPRSILCTDARLARVQEIVGASAADTQVFVTDPDTLHALTGFDLHRGLIASFQRPTITTAAALLRTSNALLIAEGVTDPENVGALMRNAAATGLDAVLFDPAAPDPFYRRCVRVSQGWSALLAHARIHDATSAIRAAAASGYRTVALTPAESAPALDAATAGGVFDHRFAMVVGAEGPGLSSTALEACSDRVRIPMLGGVESLNVATSVAVVGAFAAARRKW